MTDTIFSVVTVDVLALTYDPDGQVVRYGLHRRPAPPFAGELALPGVVVHSGERLEAAARRALDKLHLRADPVALGQLRTFDEPSRDPRGPSLSVAMWAAYPSLRMGEDTGDSLWPEIGDLPALAFDHTAIVATTRELLPALLWHDRPFTRAITGQRFTATDAVAITRQLTRHDVHRANLNRDLARIPGLAQAGTAPAAGGRPPKVWAWA